MPELPDVEGFRRTFARQAARKRILRVFGVDRGLLRNSSPSGLGRALRHRRFSDPRRHGKLLICPAEGPILVLHFGMTGDLLWSSERHPHDRLVLELEDGELRYRNMRRFGGIWLMRDQEELQQLEGRLGPDWLEVSRADFDRLATSRRGSIKAALMDQAFAAGLGNLTADEALWRAGVDPRRPVRSLDDDARRSLHKAIRKVLSDSIPHGRVPAKRTWLTAARDSAQATCPRCGAALERVKVGGRTTVFCPREQS